MPSKSDLIAVDELLLCVAGSLKARAEINEGKEQSSGKTTKKEVRDVDFVAYDFVRESTACGFFLTCCEDGRNCEARRRSARLHTLLSGTIDIAVLALLCPKCEKLVYFDVRDYGFFVVTGTVVYCRELIDFWIYHVAVIGGTFRFTSTYNGPG